MPLNGHVLVAGLAMLTVGCGNEAPGTASTVAVPTSLQPGIESIAWCPKSELPNRSAAGPKTEEETALTDAVNAVSLQYEEEPTWAGSFLKLGDLGAVFMFTDSDPDRTQTIREQLASVAEADNVEIRSVRYSLSELNAASDSLREVRPDDGWNGLVTFAGPSITRNRVRIGVTDLEAAPTLHELINLPSLDAMFCIEPEEQIPDSADGNG